MALQLKLKPRSHPSLRLFSSSSSPFPPPPSDQSPPESESESQPSLESIRSVNEILKQLANFLLGNSSALPPPSTSLPRFQELFKHKLPNNPPGSPPGASSLESIRQSLRNKAPKPGAPIAPSLIGSDGPFGKEVSERKREEGEGESKGLKTQFFKSYTYQELGEKLVKLTPAEGEKKNIENIEESKKKNRR